MAKYMHITTLVTSNTPPVPDRAQAHVVIGTPHSVSACIAASQLKTLKILTYDDCDQMLKECRTSMMKAVVKFSPRCQVLLFCTSLNADVAAFGVRIRDIFSEQDYKCLFVKNDGEHFHFKLHVLDEATKILVIRDWILECDHAGGQTIIFVRREEHAVGLHQALVADGYEVTTLRSAHTTQFRDFLLSEFKSGLTHVLITTEMYARWLDVPKVRTVINYDPPITGHESYLHCAGRAQRFDRAGAVFSLICDVSDQRVMDTIGGYLNYEVNKLLNKEDVVNAWTRLGWR